jgi:SAM-dependent methyltransferase
MLRNDCAVSYDRPNRRLVYVGKPADEGYWDSHWLESRTVSDIRLPDRFVATTTRRHLARGSRVLDAGCGLARTVFGLKQAGFEAYGIDFAPETVARINQLAPELRVTLGDVRSMPQFSDGFFDGVWSLGVVEHFYDGYRAVVAETARVLRRGGLAFVTVPSMSPLRRLKASLRIYPPWDEIAKDGFYQFALAPSAVVQEFTTGGFKFLESRPRGGVKGLKDEAPLLLRPLLQRFYDSERRSLRLMRGGLDRLLGPLTHHTRLYIFERC